MARLAGCRDALRSSCDGNGDLAAGATMKIWITKWALTRGILEASADVTEGGMKAECNRSVCFYGLDFWESEGGARSRAEELAKLKVEKAEKVIAKLRGKTGDKFKVSEFK